MPPTPAGPPPPLLLTIDTDTHASGWAVWSRGELADAGRSRPPRLLEYMGPAVVVIERPRHYPGSKIKARVDDLLDSAIEAGRLAGRYESGLCAVELITAPNWKGQAPKHVTQARARRALSASELELVEERILRDCKRDKRKASDVWDAIGIGLWRLGR